MSYFSTQELAAAKNEVAQRQPKTTAKPKTKGRGGFLTSLISEAGGTGGALGGAALGTALLPGIGTVVGAGLGGFLGGTGGRIAENEVRDHRVGLGDALKEGAVSGVASAGPLKLAKGAAGAIKGAAKGATAAETAEVQRLVSKGIPVKFSSNEASGKGVKQIINKSYTNPKSGEVDDAVSGLKNGGYSVTQKTGHTPGSQLITSSERGVTPAFTPISSSEKLPSVAVTGQRTAVPLSQTSKAERGVIHTPNTYATDTVEVAPGMSRGQNALQGANDAVNTSFLGKLTGNISDKVGKRLTEAGSGLKADKNVGGVERLNEQAGFMSKYTGSPRQQRVKMEGDMKSLSGQVDDILSKTPVELDGAQVGERLKNAATDLTDSRYLDLDLNNPSVKAITDRYSEKFANAKDAKSVNDIVKTLNKTATRAQNKLVDEKGGVLTAQEQAALALKRAGDDVLSSVPEIAPLKKNMAQIFEVTPQVAKQGEKGLSSSLVGGLKVKTPVQAGSAVASHLGSALQGGADETAVPGAKGFASRILAGKALTSPLPDEAMQQQQDAPVDTPPQAIGGQATSLTADDILAQQQDDGTGEDTDPYSAANVQATVKSIIAQGGTQKDVAEFLSNAKSVNDLTATKAAKPLSAEASKTIANANSGLSSLATLTDTINKSGVPKATLLPGRGLFGGLVGNKVGTSQYDTAAKNISDVITRLRSGAAITDQEAKFYNSQLPQAFDSPETVQEKLGIFQDLFTSVANQTGSAGTDLQSSLTQ